jgi:signal recognition particle subunit SRP54
MRKTFTLDEFRSQLRRMRRLGWSEALDRAPEVTRHLCDKETLVATLPRCLGILDAMTPAERADPSLLNATRVRRIASGSGVSPEMVGRLVTGCENVRREMETMTHEGPWRRIWFLLGWKPFPPLPPTS